jgi:hypothetical protein
MFVPLPTAASTFAPDRSWRVEESAGAVVESRLGRPYPLRMWDATENITLISHYDREIGPEGLRGKRTRTADSVNMFITRSMSEP